MIERRRERKKWRGKERAKRKMKVWMTREVTKGERES